MSAQAMPHACILIPTYDNEGTLADVVTRALATGLEVLVVDDGSTAATSAILDAFDGITVHRHARNRGKGAALKTGFARALERGFTHAVTLDSDGQHLPEDVPLLLERMRAEPEALIIGSRDLREAGAKSGSRFGCRFSNFWTYVETGQRVDDTQSGFRVYPLQLVEQLYLRTNGFSFEVEVLVKAAWTGAELRSVPIRVHYPSGRPGDERVSHFRPLWDFFLIGCLNTHLVFLRISLPAPFLAMLSQRRFHRQSLRQRLREAFGNLLLEGHGSPRRVAGSVGLGLFMGITPLWGFQIPLTLTLAHLLRASKTIAVVAAHISFPLMIPPILYASLMLGRLLMGEESQSLTTLELERRDFSHWIVGSFALATIVALLGFGLTLAIFSGAKRSGGHWKKAR